eukprot:jgi/Ulvmu1/803/UM010_0177.1
MAHTERHGQSPRKLHSCIAVRRGLAYQLRLELCDHCLEATVQAHEYATLGRMALTVGVAVITLTWIMRMNLQVAVTFAGLACLASCWAYSTAVAKETLRILPRVGIVLTSTSMAGFNTCRFLDWEHAGPIIINEHVTTVAVSSYLAILDVQAKKLLPVFDSLRPPLALLQEVYRAVMAMPCGCLSGDTIRWEDLNP